MNILLINAVLWPFVLLVGVPVLLHLFARTRPPVYNFSSIDFILRIIRSTMRIKRPQDWLLLLIRTLLFTALVLLFFRPLLFLQRKLAGHLQKKNIVLVVDATASMAYVEGAQTRFASACAEASEILSGLSSKDFANIVWVDSCPEAVFPQPGVNLDYLQNVLRRSRITSEAGDIEEAIRLAVRMLEGTEGTREMYLLSDFQKNTWEHADTSVPPGIDVIKVKIGEGPAPNGAITDVHCSPSRPIIGEETTIYCEVHNYSPQSFRRTVFLNVEESRQSLDLMIPAWNKAVATFKYKFSSPGVFMIRVALSEDSFVMDDQRAKLVEVHEFLSAGIVAGKSAEEDVWRRALNALGWVRTQTISVKDLVSELPFDILMLAGWNGEGREKLEKKLREGSTVICFPAAAAALSNVAALAGAVPDKDIKGVLRWEQTDERRTLEIVNERDAVFELFEGGLHGDPARGVFRARLDLPRSVMQAGDLLLQYDDGVPALTRFNRNGKLLLWNLPLDPEFSNWAGQVEFLPFLGELLLTSRAEVEVRDDLLDRRPGESVVWKPDRDLLVSDVALWREDRSAIPIREQADLGAVSFVSDQVLVPGVCTWEHLGKPMGLSVVNFPAVESDLRTMSLDEAESAGTVTLAGASAVRQLRDGIDLWPYLLGLAAALVLVEAGVLVWAERTG
ncbi:VWA domain-containing protein [Verrucomicrobiota bacterium]